MISFSFHGKKTELVGFKNYFLAFEISLTRNIISRIALKTKIVVLKFDVP